MKVERQSNIELLRMLCMLFIVCHHMIVHALPSNPEFGIAMGAEWYGLQLLNCMCYVAVNVFILISGYFGIHIKFRSFIRFYIMLAFYGCVLYHLHLYLIDSHINRWSIYNTLFPISNSPGLWFVKSYFVLYLLSPILNAAANALTKRQYQISILLFTVVILYYGFYREMEFAGAGYSLSNFVFLYFIGGYLKRYVPNTPKLRISSLSVYFLGSILLWCLTIYAENSDISSVWLSTVQYNHPLLVVSSIAFFLFFTTLHFSSKAINFIAPYSLAVYILHENVYFNQKIYSYIGDCYFAANSWGRVLMLFAIILAIWSMGYTIDIIRRGLTYPIEKWCVISYEKLKAKYYLDSKHNNNKHKQ